MSERADLVIHNARIVLGHGLVPGNLAISKGRIQAILCGGMPECAVEAIDAQGRQVTPGLVDIHTHGIGNFLFESSPQDLLAGAALLATFGTTTFLPTLYTTLTGDHLDHLNLLAEAVDQSAGVERGRGARIAGFHLEGPFLALSGAAGRQLPVDLPLLREMLSACRGLTRVVSTSPEVPGITAAIELLRAEGVVVFLTHTQASCAQTERAIDAGATHATHFYDVFPAPPETEPGVRPAGAVESILADRRCSVDFIADGIHVDPAAIRLAAACKEWDQIALISDSNIGAGLPAGRYDTPWGFPVRVSPEDAARIDDPRHPEYGGLAGSSLVLSRAVANIQKWFHLPWSQAWNLATVNPARIANLSCPGRLEVGQPADLVIWNDDLTPHLIFIDGRRIEAPGQPLVPA